MIKELLSYSQLTSSPLLLRSEVHTVVDHDGVLIAEVLAYTLGASRALSLNVV